MRAQRGWQQFESVLIQLAGSRQVDGAEGGEPAAEQVVERDVEYCEDRDAEQRLSVE
jgi:hypothetical protein